jgi:hypothetical protein
MVWCGSASRRSGVLGTWDGAMIYTGPLWICSKGPRMIQLGSKSIIIVVFAFMGGFGSTMGLILFRH